MYESIGAEEVETDVEKSGQRRKEGGRDEGEER